MEQQSDTGTASLSTNGAAQVFESLLTKDEGASEPATPDVEEQSAPIEQDQPEPEQEEQSESEDADDAQPEETQETFVKVMVNGEEVEISLDEAIKGYQRTSDYTRKTQQLAQERKATEAIKTEATQQRQAYEQAVNQALNLAQQFAPQEPNWDALYQSDPLEFVRQREAWRDRKDQLTALQTEQQRLQQISQQEQLQSVSQHVQNEAQRLMEHVPEWKDEGRAKLEKTAIVEYAKQLGFTPDELNKVYDHRAVLALRKAMLYDKLMSKKGLVDNKVRQAPKMVKPGANNPKPTSSLDDSMRKLRQSGKKEDAARAFMNLI
jgi:hypothetical protein